MASKYPRSKPDHDTRARRQKLLEAPKEPKRPKTHWDHVLEEMIWLSKDFESERKWKLSQAKKVAIRASKGLSEQANREERRIKEEEHRLRKVALNISKDVKKFWMKIEKLVSYKHQLKLDEKKKKVLDKQLEFLLGQTERYSTMLAENLVNSPTPGQPSRSCTNQEKPTVRWQGGDDDHKASDSDEGSKSNTPGVDEDYSSQSENESEDDENTIEEDEALITHEEREEELEALHSEIDLPLDEILKRYTEQEENHEKSFSRNDALHGSGSGLIERNVNEVGIKCISVMERNGSSERIGSRCVKSNGVLSLSGNHRSEMETYKSINSFKKLTESGKKLLFDDGDDEQEDEDFVLSSRKENEDGMDDETTIIEEEQLANAESDTAVDEIALLQKENEIPLEELLARYNEDWKTYEHGKIDSEFSYGSGSEEFLGSSARGNSELKQPVNESISFEPVECLYGPNDEAECLGKSGENIPQNEDIISGAAAAARSAQPTGNTFSTTRVRTKFPFLIKYPLREYQHIGLDWLVTMYEKRLNGILADEMGLGKTIMTIALLAHLACEKGIWGPHLIVVPTSVMLNWETEFLKWCPAFKILTYFGTAKDRRIKRQGWLKPNSFHVCITTYRLVIQDSKVFKRKKWKYLILDEAHLIKNWKSQRWQTLLNFNSKRRILLTGTPLQNDLMELWSLMHFLMPHIFQSHQEFKDWFSNPISGMVEGQEKINKEVVDRLHNVLRPFILRRLKRDVEKQLPMKHEHVISCRLSRRQRNLYEDFISSSETQVTLSSANFFGMISVIMQLRKVCNHPDLFEGRPIVSSFDMSGIDMQLSYSVCSICVREPFSTVNLSDLGFLFTHHDFCMTSWEDEEIQAAASPLSLLKHPAFDLQQTSCKLDDAKRSNETNIFEKIQMELFNERLRVANERASAMVWWNSLRCKKKPIYATDLRELVSVKHPVYHIHSKKHSPSFLYSSKLADIVLSPVERFRMMVDQVESFMFAIPAARAPPPVCWCSKSGLPVFIQQNYKDKFSEVFSPLLTPFRPAIVRRQVYFPDQRLIQFDCGKLQELAVLLRQLKAEGHRALIFTQMTKMLDILESFINLYGYTYMRLDGSTPPEERQALMQRFNTNPKFFLFILSTRSGGVGINLVGADTVIFYDSDWNPAMDQQAQDRCHRIGQTREVHIYRLISESTIEENILKKANQKRALDNLVIQSGSYNTEFFKKLNPLELFSGHRTIQTENVQTSKTVYNSGDINLSSADLEAALRNAEDEADYMALKKVEEEEAVDNQEFTEEIIGKLEDDELANEEDLKPEDAAEFGGLNAKLDGGLNVKVDENDCINRKHHDEGNVTNGNVDEVPLSLTVEGDDIDMLGDVRQMAAAAAAAAAAGQAIPSVENQLNPIDQYAIILSVENQLRPIDQYAIRFRELWDPIIVKADVETHIQIDETEWELERIEKLKDDMEAENDDDEEPLVYERWDADFATEVYKQKVEALAQHQLLEDLEREAKEKDALECEISYSPRNDAFVTPKLKPKKKTKKTKFKSLKKGALVSKARAARSESSMEEISVDDGFGSDEMITSPRALSPCPTVEKKRKPKFDANEPKINKKSKKLTISEPTKSNLHSKSCGKYHDERSDMKSSDNDAFDLESKNLSRGSIRGKLFISVIPPKRVFTIKQEKLKKKGNICSKDCFPPPDLWSPCEDAILCAAVHEYGPNWNLSCEILRGGNAGGFYRGRFRHPVHCCERFRELIQRYVVSISDGTNSEKAVNTGSAKSLFRVTEDNVQNLLGITSELPDHEPLVQKHFFDVLSVAWRHSSHSSIHNNSLFSRNGFYSQQHVCGSTIHYEDSLRKKSEILKFTNSYHCGVLVAAALNDKCNHNTDDDLPILNQRKLLSVEKDQLDITLELQGDRDEITPLPFIIGLSIIAPDPPLSLKMMHGVDHNFKSSRSLAEDRFGTARGTCESSFGGESLRACVGDTGPFAPRPQHLGKHKLFASDSVKPSKTQLRRSSLESIDLHCLSASPVHQSLSAALTESGVIFDDLPLIFPEAGGLEFDSNFQADMVEEVAPLAPCTPVTIPFHFGQDLISEVDDFDWSILPEFTDIG